jgi:ABC-type antimicrobial peptide transport system permease subunit
MGIPLLDGRDLRADESQPGEALVNRAFAKAYFGGEDPVGKSFEKIAGPNEFSRVEVVGLVGDAQYDGVREPVKPTIYVPLFGSNSRASFIVRTTIEDPLALAETLRREVPKARSEFYVSNVTTQQALNDSKTVRERLIALLASFFASVALILSSVGIYGVLHYSVIQLRREIGVRIAMGAQAASIARRVTRAVFAPVLLGSCVGLAIGVGLEQYVVDLLWNVKATEPAMMAVPLLSILAAVLAAVPEVLRAVRVDPTELLRTD